MARLVCPHCDAEMKGSRNKLATRGVDHMHEEHDEEVSEDYIKGVIDAHI